MNEAHPNHAGCVVLFSLLLSSPFLLPILLKIKYFHHHFACWYSQQLGITLLHFNKTKVQALVAGMDILQKAD